MYVSIKIETRLSLSLSKSFQGNLFLKGTPFTDSKKMCFLSVDNFLRSRLLPTGALGVVFGFLLLRFARIRFRLPILSGKERRVARARGGVSERDQFDYTHALRRAFRRKRKK